MMDFYFSMYVVKTYIFVQLMVCIKIVLNNWKAF